MTVGEPGVMLLFVIPRVALFLSWLGLVSNLVLLCLSFAPGRFGSILVGFSLSPTVGWSWFLLCWLVCFGAGVYSVFCFQGWGGRGASGELCFVLLG